MKVLPLVIGCALLLGISSASATCSYVSASPGNSWDFNILMRGTNATSSTTYSGVIHATIANVTSVGSHCEVGFVMKVTSGNYSTLSGTSYSFIQKVYDKTVTNSSDLSWLLISMSVSNKSYYNLATNAESAASWDDSGVLNWMFTSDSNYGIYILMSVSRVSTASTPGYEPWALLLAGAIGIASIIGIALKKRH